jgi:hypothetical protein
LAELNPVTAACAHRCGISQEPRLARFSNLEKDDPSSKFRPPDQKAFERENVLRQPFGVIETIDSENELRP